MSGKEGLDALLGKALAGELEPAERDSLERALAQDPGLADELALDARFSALLAIALDEDGRFERALRERHRAGREQTPFVDALRRRAVSPGRRASPAAWLAGAAAAVFLGLGLWIGLRPDPPRPVPVPAEPPRASTRSFRDEGNGRADAPPARDATIIGAPQDRNLGTHPGLQAGGHGLAVLFWWNLSEVPPESRVESATLVLGDATTLALGTDLRLYEVRRPWVESQVTWKESARNVPWEHPGARGPHDRGGHPVGTLSAGYGHRAMARLNAEGVALVQRWIDSPGQNHGLLLVAEAVSDRIAGFASRESPDPATRPALTLTWTTPNGK
ncbi:MAG TPA: DNRLRE domain-containing protein [Planctomycetota bacterium]|nr:DNRLRE domain-containing protein [Planctomycetota bacterium]